MLLEAFRDERFDPRDALGERLDAIEKRNRSLLAFREVHAAQALERASRLAGDRKAAASMPLFGVPVAIKDNVAEAGTPNRAGRKDGAAQPEPADAAVVERLSNAGAIVVGRANMDELAYGVTGSNPHTGQVRNPRDPSRHPGGSSAGAASAVASGMVPLAIGTDTAGSVRIPASLCGVVGMRPTRGWVPSSGIAPLCPSLDTAGPMARTVRDVALLLSVMVGRPTLARAPDDLAEALRSLKVAALDGSFAVDVSRGVKARFDTACEALGSMVSSVRTETLPELVGAPRASGPVIGAEASYAWGSELDAHPDWFGDEVAGHLRKGATIKAVRLLRAQDESARVVRAVDEALERFDVLALPTTATVATSVQAPGSQLQFLALTVPFSLGGHPSITVPMGEASGMPAGLQLVGRRGDDARLLALAAAFEGHGEAAGS